MSRNNTTVPIVYYICTMYDIVRIYNMLYLVIISTTYLKTKIS